MLGMHCTAPLAWLKASTPIPLPPPPLHPAPPAPLRPPTFAAVSSACPPSSVRRTVVRFGPSRSMHIQNRPPARHQNSLVYKLQSRNCGPLSSCAAALAPTITASSALLYSKDQLSFHQRQQLLSAGAPAVDNQQHGTRHRQHHSTPHKWCHAPAQGCSPPSCTRTACLQAASRRSTFHSCFTVRTSGRLSILRARCAGGIPSRAGKRA